jgi:hypothetical protein
MPLPTIETPTYKLVIPSTNKTVEYRPFLVKEEKLLLVAKESNDTGQIIDIMKRIVDSCTFNKLNVNKLSTLDLEYIFLNLRTKSVGETSNIILKCQHCDAENNIVVNLEDSVIEKSEESTEDKIQVNDKIGIKLRPVRLQDVASIDSDDQEKSLSAACRAVIESIYDAEKLYETDDCTTEELDQFIDSLPHDAMVAITHFISHQPFLANHVHFKCAECGKENKITVKGFQSFF